MSYISFYRKWRPQTFSEVIGQEHIVKTLQNAISKNRLVHGYMFCGPKGTGKTSIARILSKAINCIHGPSIEPCNKCDNCVSITAGANVDVIEIDAASNRKIDDIRDMRDKVKYLPMMLRKKIYIIDEVHMLTLESFNALLKTLEEPPEHVIFIMATTDPYKVIQTIMSRCQRFDFEPISVDRIKNRLKDIASIENIDITDSAINMVAKYSSGSLRDADGILEQLSSFGDSRVTVDEVSSILGIIDQEMLFELANIVLEKNINQSLLFISRLFSTSFSLNAFISEFTEHLYSLYVIKNYENPSDILDMPDEFKESFYNQAGLFTTGQLECLIDLFTGLLSQIKNSENPKTFFKAAVIKALNTEAIKGGQAIKNSKKMELDIQQINNDLTELRPGSINGGKVSTMKPVNIEKAEGSKAKNVEEIKTDCLEETKMTLAYNVLKNPSKDLSEELPPNLKKSPNDFSQIILEIWETLLLKIRSKSVPLQAVLKEVKRFKVQGNKIFFSLESKNHWHKSHLNKLDNKTLIQELLKSLTGQEFEITFDFISDENINESLNLAYPSKKSQALSDLSTDHKDSGGATIVLTNMDIPKVNVDENIAGIKNNPGNGTASADRMQENNRANKDNSNSKEEDIYGYFEKKFKVEEE